VRYESKLSSRRSKTARRDNSTEAGTAHKQSASSSFPIVGIGASADGLEAMTPTAKATACRHAHMKRRRQIARTSPRQTSRQPARDLIAEISELREQLGSGTGCSSRLPQMALIEAQHELKASNARYADMYDFCTHRVYHVNQNGLTVIST